MNLRVLSLKHPKYFIRKCLSNRLHTLEIKNNLLKTVYSG